MSNEEIEKTLREYIGKTVHMSLATAKDNKPWVCEVHFANDEQLNLFFVSKMSTRHCQEIATNPFVAGNIVRQHSLTESPHGIYFEGHAQRLDQPSESEIENYCQALGRDRNDLNKRLVEPEPDGHRIYKITVENWYIFGKFDGDTSQKRVLPWNGGVK